VPVDDARVVRSGREAPLLARARRARKLCASWRLGAGVVAGFGLLSLLVALAVLLIASPGVIGTLGMLAMVSVPLVMALLAFRRGQRERRELAQSLDRAWALVAGDVLASRGEELTAQELASSLRTDERYAEGLLAELNVSDFVHARVTDEGDVVYSTRAPARLRVDQSSHEAGVMGANSAVTELGGETDSAAEAQKLHR
jgi:hypothetical protein